MNKPSRIPPRTTPRQPARPAAKPPVMQTKLATQQAKTIQPKAKVTPAAPPVYRPQPVPKCLQLKTSNAPAQTSRTTKSPRSQPVPKVLQTKMVRPERKVFAQPKGSANRSVLQLAEEEKRPPKKQALISSYFGPGAAAPKQYLEDHPELHMAVDADAVVITGEAPTYLAKDQDGSRKLGELDLYEDNKGGYWINNINVVSWARRKGIAMKLIKKAIADHGKIYASTQDAADDTAEDTRHLTPDGYAFVRACVNKGLKVVYTFPVK